MIAKHVNINIHLLFEIQSMQTTFLCHAREFFNLIPHDMVSLKTLRRFCTMYVALILSNLIIVYLSVQITAFQKLQHYFQYDCKTR